MYGLIMLWAASHVTISSEHLSVLIGFSSVGYISTGIVTGYLFQTYTPLSIMYMSIVAVFGEIVFFLGAWSAAKYCYSFENERHTNESEEELKEALKS